VISKKDSKTIIIAEAGVNHNGDINKALQLINKAAETGADYIKFQHTNPDLISKYAKKAKYQINNTKNNESQKSMVDRFHLDWFKAYPILIAQCKKKKIRLITSAFSANDLSKIEKYNFDFIKIPSGEIINYPLLEVARNSNKKIILSSGLATIKEIKLALDYLLKKKSKKEIFLLHCVTAYPVPYEYVNLRSLIFLSKKFSVNIGLSDHSLGIEVPIASIAMGAKIIEKHLTLSKKLNGPDHSSSLEPKEFKNMVHSIRNIEKAIGKENKIPSRIELINRSLVRQSVHAIKKINKGEVFSKSNIKLMRPADGIEPFYFYDLIGKKSPKKYLTSQPIKKKDFKKFF
jgi:N,N'-diacetyllegionaminate synthase